MILGLPPLAGKTWAGIYIDDLGVVQVASAESIRLSRPLRDTEIMDRADAVCEPFGPLRESGKNTETSFIL